MKLHQVLQIINEEESAPEKMAAKITKDVNRFGFYGDGNDIDKYLSSEFNQKSDDKLPIGNGKFLDTSNKKDMKTFGELLISLLDIKDPTNKIKTEQKIRHYFDRQLS